MFKKEINFISDLNLNKLQVLGEKFKIEDLDKCDIHPAIAHFIKAVIKNEIYSDRKKIEKDSLFDYHTDRINNYFDLITEEIFRTQLFDLRYIKQIVQKSIIFNINFLTRPNKTITQLIFSNQEVKSVEEIILSLSHAYYYRYLQKILFTYLDKKKIILMRRGEFFALLKRIDEITKETYLEESLTTAVNSMGKFIDPNSKSAEKIPLQAVIWYLQEKELDEFVSKIENSFGDDYSKLCLITEINTELRSVTPEAEMEIENNEVIEDELVVDNNQNDSAGIEPSEIIEDSPTNEGLVNEEIFEVIDDEAEIPNNEILSSDGIKETEDDAATNYEDQSIQYSSEESDSKPKLNGETNNDLNEDDLKKKPESIPLLRKLINLSSIFDSLLPKLKPFSNIDKKEDFLEDNVYFDEINYQLDHSTLSEEISIIEAKKIKIENEIVNYEKDLTVDSGLNDKNIFYSDDTHEQIDLVEGEIPNGIDLTSSIDSVIDEGINEIEFSEEDGFSEDDNNGDVENTKIFLENEKITIFDEGEEELTEVFTDLAFLDGETENDNENSINQISENAFDESEYLDDPEKKDTTDEMNSDKSVSFSEILNFKDMTKVIEGIFDYDMEDYHSIINRISNSTTEEDAISILDEYILNNHIENTSNEVSHFKSLISEFFSKAYS